MYTAVRNTGIKKYDPVSQAAGYNPSSMGRPSRTNIHIERVPSSLHVKDHIISFH